MELESKSVNWKAEQKKNHSEKQKKKRKIETRKIKLQSLTSVSQRTGTEAKSW